MLSSAMDLQVKTEIFEPNLASVPARPVLSRPPGFGTVIELSSSSDEDEGCFNDDASSAKRLRVSAESSNEGGREIILPPRFLDPAAQPLLTLPAPPSANPRKEVVMSNHKQFWKAGDYEGPPGEGGGDPRTGGMDHVRVHPKFLHSNATSHKWALGAFAELLDNALDEVCSGATYVNIDMLLNKKDKTPMLIIEDNGGGMDPDKMRQCMSLGYSAKSKLANTIGQYGNGFKTSTMRLGADVIVFSRCPEKDGKGRTQSIGLLSYSFLRGTGKEDIVVPISRVCYVCIMYGKSSTTSAAFSNPAKFCQSCGSFMDDYTLDYEWKDDQWEKIIRSSAEDWNRNVETIVQWSPFANEAQLLQQFYMLKTRGTRIFIYNLWEDDQGQLELDFDSDPYDIQIRGVNRDEKNIKMAAEYPNSKHFLTYKHSLRSYVSILYLRLPRNFRIVLRGKDVEHHNIVNDMMMTQEVTYRPQASADGVPRDSNLVAVVTIGFVKDARAHVDVQGFNVYHKNRLIKPFWRVWNAAGSDGRGVIGLLEANFVEPAHDKQGFERTTVLARLETKLVNMQKNYWSSNCHHIGYAPRRNKTAAVIESSPERLPEVPSRPKRKVPESDKSYTRSHHTQVQTASKSEIYVNGNASGMSGSKTRTNGYANGKPGSKTTTPLEESSSPSQYTSSGDDTLAEASQVRVSTSADQSLQLCKKEGSHMIYSPVPVDYRSEGVIEVADFPSDLQVLEQLKKENRQLKERLSKKEDDILGELISDLQKEKDKRALLEKQLLEAVQKVEELNKEQESLIDIFSEERDRRDVEEEKLRKELKEKSITINELLEKLKVLER